MRVKTCAARSKPVRAENEQIETMTILPKECETTNTLRLHPIKRVPFAFGFMKQIERMSFFGQASVSLRFDFLVCIEKRAHTRHPPVLRHNVGASVSQRASNLEIHREGPLVPLAAINKQPTCLGASPFELLRTADLLTLTQKALSS